MKKRISNKQLVIFLVCVLVLAVIWDDISWWNRIVGSLCVSGGLLLIDFIKPHSFGAGDVKLMAVSGLLLGMRGNILAFIYAVLIAGGYCLVGMCFGKIRKDSEISFGPFLCIGIVVVLFWGRGDVESPRPQLTSTLPLIRTVTQYDIQ